MSFDLVAGEVHALLGENGAGKSTLIKVITGACQPDQGDMLVNGEAIHHLTPSRARELGIACIYQQPALFPDLSVSENIALRLEKATAFRKVRWKERRQVACRLLERVGAEISPDALAGSLSMPEQQLVEVACAIGADAKVVIMDEPTASLTRKEQHQLFKIVRELKSEGVGVIYISHRLEEIFALADRVTVLRDGESIGTNSVDELTERSMIQLMVGREVEPMDSSATGKFGDEVLSIRHLYCVEGGVEDISLDVRAGEILGISGLVGAGRTELARVLFGITPADGGEILLDGKPVKISSPRDAISKGIAYVPEDRRKHGVILEMPVSHNITMAIHQRIFSGTLLRRKAENDLAEQFISDLGIKTSSVDTPAGNLSGGNQQKVSLARWLATKPKVLILDEPTQGVDIGAKGEIHKIIRKLAAEGVAVLMISSDLPEVMGMSDRIAVMRNGRVVDVMLSHAADPERIMSAALGGVGRKVSA